MKKQLPLLMFRAGTKGVVRVGAIGHRRLRDEMVETLSERVREAVAIAEMHGKESSTDPIAKLVFLSSLAEGADRLVVREALRWEEHHHNKVDLEVVLPFQIEDYLKDFKTSGSKAEFLAYLRRAVSVTIEDPTPTPEEAYERAGHYLVDHCDVLVAIWDGCRAAGRGGTGDIVMYAQEVHRPLLWIDSERGTLSGPHGSRRSH